MISRPDNVWDINSRKYTLKGEAAVGSDERCTIYSAECSGREYYVRLFDYKSNFELDSFYERLERCLNSCKNYVLPVIPLKRPFMGYLIEKRGNVRSFSDLKNGALKIKLFALFKLANLLDELDKNGFAVCGNDESVFSVVDGKYICIGYPECVYRKGTVCRDKGRIMRRPPEAAYENGHIADWQEFSYVFALMLCDYLSKSGYYYLENAGEVLGALMETEIAEKSTEDEFEFEDDTEYVIPKESSQKSSAELMEGLVFAGKVPCIFDENASDAAHQRGDDIERISARLKQMIITAMNADAIHSIRPDFAEWGGALKECYVNLVTCHKCGCNFFYAKNEACPMCGESLSPIMSLTVHEYFNVSEFNEKIWYPFEKRSSAVTLSKPRYTRVIKSSGENLRVLSKDIGLNSGEVNAMIFNYSEDKLRVTMNAGERVRFVDFSGEAHDVKSEKTFEIPIPKKTLNPAKVIFRAGDQVFRFTFSII